MPRRRAIQSVVRSARRRTKETPSMMLEYSILTSQEKMKAMMKSAATTGWKTVSASIPMMMPQLQMAGAHSKKRSSGLTDSRAEAAREGEAHDPPALVRSLISWMRFDSGCGCTTTCVHAGLPGRAIEVVHPPCFIGEPGRCIVRTLATQ